MADFARHSRLLSAALAFTGATMLYGCPDSDDEETPTDTATAADTTDTSSTDTAPSDTAEPSDTPVTTDVSEAFCECDDDCLSLGDGSLCNGTVCTSGVDGIPCEDAPDADPDTGPTDVVVTDVSEAFCECDDDCLPLGDGSLCNGTVCTFGVDGMPCDSPDVAPDADAELDTTPDVADAEPDAPDAEEDAEPDAEVQTVSVVFDIEGGFTGAGGRDISVDGTTMTTDDPFASVCTDTLSAEQSERLLNAATGVSWDSLESSYVPTDNPTCCCDQFFYTLTVTIDGGDAGFSSELTWCDESWDALLPASVQTFVSTLNALADEVACSE